MKKDDTDNADNYLGITILSFVGKFFTSILNNSLNIIILPQMKFRGYIGLGVSLLVGPHHCSGR
jgi:hypothetical protein